MATQYGDYQEPGIITDLTSSSAIPTSGEAPADVGIVGQANLGGGTDEGSADPNTVYQVTRDTSAREWFGDESGSLLTQSLIDALNEDAMPVYAVAPSATTVSGEDHSGASSTTVDLTNDALRETASSMTITLDGTDLTPNIVYDDVSTYSPGSGECFVNPVYGKMEIPSTPSSSLTADYVHFDYATAHDAMVNDAGERIDFFAPLNEARPVVDDANSTVNSMEDEYELAVLNAGADIYISDTSAYSNPYDDSRTQLVYPTRFEDGSSVLGALTGLKAAVGLDTTVINSNLSTNRRLMYSLTRSQRGNLINNNVVALADEVGGARIADDPTTVTSSNSDEMNLKYGFSRLVMDYIIETVRDNEKPFIGRLNNPTLRRTFASLIRSELNGLLQSGMILSYSINVAKVDATTASLEVSVDLAEPLRFIENTMTVGGSV